MKNYNPLGLTKIFHESESAEFCLDVEHDYTRFIVDISQLDQLNYQLNKKY